MSSPLHYRCEEKVVHLLEIKKLSLSALRLVHATNHYLDNHPGWQASHMNMPDTLGQNRVCTALCSVLCATTGSPGANDIGMIREGLQDLDGADLFRVLELDGRKLRFRYSHSLAGAATTYKKSKFAMLDCGIIAKLRSGTYTSIRAPRWSSAKGIRVSTYPGYARKQNHGARRSGRGWQPRAVSVDYWATTTSSSLNSTTNVSA